jgi:transcriptional regulator of acetoin/glycerol metabolism
MTRPYTAGLLGPGSSNGPAWNADLEAMIATSHRRSEDYGLCPGARPDFSPLSGSDLSTLVDQNRMLYSHAIPAMETLYQQIVNTRNMVLLTDAHGVILHSLGDADFLERARARTRSAPRSRNGRRRRSTPTSITWPPTTS